MRLFLMALLVVMQVLRYESPEGPQWLLGDLLCGAALFTSVLNRLQ